MIHFFVSQILLIVLLIFSAAHPLSADQIYKFKSAEDLDQGKVLLKSSSHLKVTQLTDETLRISGNIENSRIRKILEQEKIAFIQPDYPLQLLETYKITDRFRRSLFQKFLKKNAPPQGTRTSDNPEFPEEISSGFFQKLIPFQRTDPFLSKQWGLESSQTFAPWKNKPQTEFVVAIIDTGVDYTHEDLWESIWKNSGESGIDDHGNLKSTNGLDDDGNGYIDDFIGWDFASQDNKPFDLTLSAEQILLHGGNAGHGTHCAGTLAAQAQNGVGISGVAPQIKIMPLRFLSESGKGNTSDAVLAIDYAIKMGAKVIASSWGTPGEDPHHQELNLALREAIARAKDAGVLFISAAGNGPAAEGENNDVSLKAGFPASYDDENIISVTAHDQQDQKLASANWGPTTVDIAAPGFQIFSTLPSNHYSDLAIDAFGFKHPWDGTSMAVPFVAGAVALYWSKNPDVNWLQVKNALLESTTPLEDLHEKILTGGKLNTLRFLQTP